MYVEVGILSKHRLSYDVLMIIFTLCKLNTIFKGLLVQIIVGLFYVCENIDIYRSCFAFFKQIGLLCSWSTLKITV